MAKTPECNCFRSNVGERMATEVAAFTADFFINDAIKMGICREAIFHTALTTFVFIIDGIASMEVAAEPAKIKAIFQQRLATISEDLRCRREVLEANIERAGASIQ